MNNTIIGIIVVILILGGMVWVARPDGQSNASTSTVSSALTVEEASNYDFGTISMAAGNVKHQFKIKNTGSEPIVLKKMYTSCMCTTATLLISDKKLGPVGMPGHTAIPMLNQTIAPNEGAIVEIEFDPKAHGPAGVGRIERTVTLENNAGKPVVLQFAATVTP